MKHLFALAAVAFTLCVSAQTTEDTKKSVFSRTEFLMGAGLSNQVYDNTTTEDLGFNAGIIEHLYLGSHLFLRTGLLYKQFNFNGNAYKGAGSPFTTSIVDITPTYQFHHFEIPVIVQYEFPLGEKTLLYAGLGTGLSLNLAAYQTLQYNLSSIGRENQEFRSDIADDNMTAAQLTAHLTLGAYYKLNDKWALGLGILSTHHWTRLLQGQRNDKFNLQLYTGNLSIARLLR